MAADLLLSVDIGGTKIAAAVARQSGEIVAVLATPTPLGSDEAVAEAIGAALEAALQQAGVGPGAVAAIGIGAPGRVDRARGTWFGSTNVPLQAPPLPLVDLVRQRFGRPAHIDNDVKAGTLGEHCFGQGRGLQNLVYLSVGTGIAAGIIIGGQLYRGQGAAGEIGHAPVLLNGPLCRCGTRGCLEMMASGASIARRGQAALLAGRPTAIAQATGGSVAAVTGKMVIEAARDGDAVALEIMREAASYLAMGVLMAWRAYDPQVVVLAGGVAQAGPTLMDPLRQALAAQAGPRFAAYGERLVLTALGEHAGVLGAAAVAMSGLADAVGRPTADGYSARWIDDAYQQARESE